LPQSEEVSNCGYGSQKVYVADLPEEAEEPEPPPPQAVTEARVPTATQAARRVLRVFRIAVTSLS
jgi:hypothetical protein